MSTSIRTKLRKSLDVNLATSTLWTGGLRLAARHNVVEIKRVGRKRQHSIQG